MTRTKASPEGFIQESLDNEDVAATEVSSRLQVTRTKASPEGSIQES